VYTSMRAHVCTHACTHIYMYVRTGVRSQSYTNAQIFHTCVGPPAVQGDINKTTDTKVFTNHLDAMSCKSKVHLPLIQEAIRKHTEVLSKGGGGGEEGVGVPTDAFHSPPPPATPPGGTPTPPPPPPPPPTGPALHSLPILYHIMSNILSFM